MVTMAILLLCLQKEGDSYAREQSPLSEASLQVLCVGDSHHSVLEAALSIALYGHTVYSLHIFDMHVYVSFVDLALEKSAFSGGNETTGSWVPGMGGEMESTSTFHWPMNSFVQESGLDSLPGAASAQSTNYS